MTLGVIGYGNMGQAIVQGVSKKRLFEKIVIYDIVQEKTTRLPHGVEAVNSVEAVENTDIVLLAIKPQDGSVFFERWKHIFEKRTKPLVTIVAGLSLSFYRQWVSCPLVRVMPNTPAQVGVGATAMYFDGEFLPEVKEKIIGIFESLGLVEVITKEEMLHAVTGLSGSGPAYVFLFLSALADAGVMEGLPREIAKRLAIQTLLGSAVLAQQALKEGKSFEDLKDMVMSPAGTTTKGVYALENCGFRAGIINAVAEATKRSRELGGR